MYSDNLKKIFETKTNNIITEKKVLTQNGIIPAAKSGTYLAPLPEFIVKISFLFRNVSLEELKVLLLFQYDPRTVEGCVYELVKAGYLISSNQGPLGVFLAPSHLSLYYIKYNPAVCGTCKPISDCTRINDTKIYKTALIKNKTRLAIIGQEFLRKEKETVLKTFKAMPKASRRAYYIRIFCRNYLFKEFFKLSVSERTEFLEKLGTQEPEKTALSTTKKPSEYISGLFVSEVIAHIPTKQFLADKDYLDYCHFITSSYLNDESQLINSVYFLREFYIAYYRPAKYPSNPEQQDLNRIINQLMGGTCTVPSGSAITTLAAFSKNYSATKDYCQSEADFENFNGALNTIQREQRVTLAKKNKAPTLSELKRLDLLEQDMSTLTRQIKLRSDPFRFSITRHKGMGETITYDEHFLTLERLQANGIYIRNIIADKTRATLQVAIVPTTDNLFSACAISKKLEMAHRYFRRNWSGFHIQYIVYFLEDSSSIPDRLEDCRNLIGECRELGALFSIFETDVSYRCLTATCYFRKADYWSEVFEKNLKLKGGLQNVIQ